MKCLSETWVGVTFSGKWCIFLQCFPDNVDMMAALDFYFQVRPSSKKKILFLWRTQWICEPFSDGAPYFSLFSLLGSLITPSPLPTYTHTHTHCWQDLTRLDETWYILRKGRNILGQVCITFILKPAVGQFPVCFQKLRQPTADRIPLFILHWCPTFCRGEKKIQSIHFPKTLSCQPQLKHTRVISLFAWLSPPSSCAPSRWTVSREVWWLPLLPTEAFVRSQASACWAAKPSATPWASCTPVACMTSRDSLPSMWVSGSCWSSGVEPSLIPKALSLSFVFFFFLRV